jgi:hypothetical protein
MCTSYTNKGCHGAAGRTWKQDAPSNASVAGNLLLVLMPKCSFCVMAYTSTALLCTREETIVASSLHASPLTILITSILCVLILAGILLNRRGKRTWIALGIALAGMSMMLASVTRGGGEALYYAGNAAIFAAIWINGSFLYLWNQLRHSWNLATGRSAEATGNL